MDRADRDLAMRIDHKQALQWVRDGRWDDAHRLVQNAADRRSCLVHAYLHRVEGDMGNARYWYARAGEEMPDNSLQAEWRRLFELFD